MPRSAPISHLIDSLNTCTSRPSTGIESTEPHHAARYVCCSCQRQR
jgi:hypothetical protein